MDVCCESNNSLCIEQGVLIIPSVVMCGENHLLWAFIPLGQYSAFD